MKTKGKGRRKQPPPPWMELPEAIWGNILHRLGAIEILATAQKVCTTWRRVCNDPSMWRVIHMRNLGNLSRKPYLLEKMCRHAVDRSQGQLVEIDMEYFVTEELLHHIAERSGKLRKLSIACCYEEESECDCEGLTEVVEKLPFLEELSLTNTSIEIKCIEALGCCCPLLKSFEFNNSRFLDSSTDSDDEEEDDERNDEALAIANNLPNLHHLQLIGNSMTNEGLHAILNGCPHLVSLDLRRCFNVSLKEFSSSRYLLQMKHLKHPHDPLERSDFSFNQWPAVEVLSRGLRTLFDYGLKAQEDPTTAICGRHIARSAYDSMIAVRQQFISDTSPNKPVLCDASAPPSRHRTSDAPAPIYQLMSM